MSWCLVLFSRVVFHHRAVRSSMATGQSQTRGQCLFTAFCTVDYWQGWLTADSLYWWGSFIYIPMEQTSWIRSSESEHYSLFPPSAHHREKNKPSLGCVCCYGDFQTKRVTCPLTHETSFEEEKGNKATYLEAVVLLLGAPHSSKATQILLFLHHGCSCSACSHPKPFVLVTLLTWCSHHWPYRRSRSRQCAENRKTWQHNLEVWDTNNAILTIIHFLGYSSSWAAAFYRRTIEVTVKTIHCAKTSG